MSPSRDDVLAALVAASLTVNQYPADRAWSLLPAFRAAGLLDPAQVGPMAWDDLVGRMKAAGYDRGGFVPIVGARLAELMLAVQRGTLEGMFRAASDGDQRAFEAEVCQVKGFGPRVARTAWVALAPISQG
jgi:hypothetical protein